VLKGTSAASIHSSSVGLPHLPHQNAISNFKFQIN
jgi:hypothetical protein